MNPRLRQERTTFLLFLATVFVSLMCALPIVTATMPNGRYPALRESRPAVPLTFEQVDRNGDGFVDREEARAVPGLAEVFERADLRHPDGRLDKVEFAKALSLIEEPGRP